MNRFRIVRLVRGLLAAAIVISALAALSGSASAAGNVGYVYSSTNQAAGNSAVIFQRRADGSLTFVATVPTGGLGLGTSLGSQGAVTLTDNGRFLLVVNAGSDDLSVFAVRGSNLVLVDREPTHGDRPVSVTVSKNIVYVLNSGLGANISGFTMAGSGALTPLADSTRSLSADGTVGSQVQFSPDGKNLVVTERGINAITTWTVDRNGLPGAGNTQASSGVAPYGFDFDNRGHLIVSEAAQGALSSYSFGYNATLNVVTASASTNQAAPCWVAVSPNGRFAYTTNAGSASISGFSIANNGALTLLNADGVTGDTGAGTNPSDLTFSNNGQFIYALSNRTNSIVAFAVHSDGSLTALPGIVNPFMGGAAGIASR